MIEIDALHFCDGACKMENGIIEASIRCLECPWCHCKWPTPAQFEKEYGRKPDFWTACYIFDGREWSILPYGTGYIGGRRKAIVVACTPYGKPPKGLEV